MKKLILFTTGLLLMTGCTIYFNEPLVVTKVENCNCETSKYSVYINNSNCICIVTNHKYSIGDTIK